MKLNNISNMSEDNKQYKLTCRAEVGGTIWIKAKDADEAEEKLTDILSHYGHDVFSAEVTGKKTFYNLVDSDKWDKLTIEGSKVTCGEDTVYTCEEVPS